MVNKPFLKGRKSMTINIAEERDADMVDYLAMRRRITGKPFTKGQFIETAIARELARVRGKNPDELPDIPDQRELSRKRRRGKDG